MKDPISKRAERAKTEARNARQNRMILYALGLVGWFLLALHVPFGWELPRYAFF